MNITLIFYLISLVIMGSNGIVASFIPFSSIEIVFLRTVIGSIVLVIASIIKKEKFECLHDKHDLFNLVMSGIMLGSGWLFLFESYRQIGVSIGTLLYYIGPILAMILSPIFFKEKLTKPKIIGAIVVAIGIVLLNGVLAGDTSKIFGLFCGVMSGVTYAAMVLFNKNVKNATGMENTVCQVVVSFILVFVYMLFTDGIHIKIEGFTWFPVIWIGIVNTGVTCLLYYSTIPKLPITTVALFSYLDPVSAVLLSFIILGESFTIIQMVGAILIIGGAAFSQLYKYE